MLAPWQVREHLVGQLRIPAVLATITEAEPGSWTRTREDQLLDYLEKFVDGDRFLTAHERTSYEELLERPRRHRPRGTGSPASAANLRPDRQMRDVEISTALGSLTSALVTRAISHPKAERDLRDGEVPLATAVVEGELFRATGNWPDGFKRTVLARLCWARNELTPSDSALIPAFLSKWWGLLREIEELGPAELRDVDLELNTTANLLRLTRELTGIRAAIAKPYKWADANAIQLGEEAEELSRYVTDLLFARLPHLLRTTNGIDITSDAGDEESVGALVCLAIRVLLQHHNVFFRRRLRRLHNVVDRVRAYSTTGLPLTAQGRCLPTSPAWVRYGDACIRLRSSLSNYVAAAKNGSDVKPYVILVVGNPGTGKSDFLESSVLQILATNGVSATPVRMDLSQARSSADALAVAWRSLKEQGGPLRVLVLEEFDTEVAGFDQFRLALQPLWDGVTQVIGRDGLTATLQEIKLGPYVAVCMMSKVATANEARQFLARVSKGTDFLSRVDMIIEIPHFDSAETQIDLVASMIASRWPASGATEIAVDEAALLFLGSMDATDNFRSVAKALKTAPRGTPITFDALNIDASRRAVFELLLAELSTSTPDSIAAVISHGHSKGTNVRLRVDTKASQRLLRAELAASGICAGKSGPPGV